MSNLSDEVLLLLSLGTTWQSLTIRYRFHEYLKVSWKSETATEENH